MVELIPKELTSGQIGTKVSKDENGEPLFNDVDENSNEENEDGIPQF